LLEHDGIGDEESLTNLVWDIVTFPFQLLHWFVKAVEVTWDGFDQDILLGEISLPLKIHPILNLGGTSVVSYGAFARLEAGVEGLIHVSEMSLEGADTVHDVISEEQEVNVRILHVDAVNQRMGLSLNLDGENA